MVHEDVNPRVFVYKQRFEPGCTMYGVARLKTSESHQGGKDSAPQWRH